METIIIDDYLEPEYFKLISKTVKAPFFPWHYKDNISDYGESADSKFGFTSLIMKDDYPITQYDVITKLYVALKWFIEKNEMVTQGKLFRMRADMLTNIGQPNTQAPHVDHDFNHRTSIFYLNEADGDTILYEDKSATLEKIRITPKPNRIVFFEGLTTHTGMNPIKHPNRILLNSNFKEIR